MHAPVNIQLIGQEIAIAWDDGAESYLHCERLRAASVLVVGLGTFGGGLGALLRYGVGKWTLAWFGGGFPVGAKWQPSQLLSLPG